MRQIVLDTETTGLDPATHRIIEIGCVELVNHVPTGRTFHTYLNPERASDARAFEVHKLSDDFLKNQPFFRDKADAFLDFIAGDQLVIHNAEFDMGFVNWEMKRIAREALLMSRVIDTISIARQKYPGAQASLDALCRRFEIDLSIRAERHGALIDAGLLARVYLELIGGRQPGLDFALNGGTRGAAILMPRAKAPAAIRPPRRDLPGASPSAEEIALHDTFLGKIKDPIWRKQ
jgi:DNA polymerase III subunit epsilon